MKKRLAGVLLLLLPLSSWADVEEGRRIYFEGRLSDGKPVPAYLGGIPSPRPVACVNCHRESGLGTSESGKTIPPVAWSTLDREEAFGFDYGRFSFLRPQRRPYDEALFHRVITTGVNSSGQVLKETMPRYVLTNEQSRSLVAFLKTLFTGHSPGVDDQRMTLALVVDTRLPQALIDQHLAFFDGLLKMKNAEARREELRKRFAPVQKIPQYLSYRKWRFVVWKLSPEPAQWANELARYYEQEPVFAVLAPLVAEDYPRLGRFCEERELPCLFPPLAQHGGGGYYNFMLRDWDKRLRQYLSVRNDRDAPLRRVTATGDIERLEAQPERIDAVASEAALRRFIEQYRQQCADSGTILLMPTPRLLELVGRIDCPQAPARVRLKLILTPDTGFGDYAALMAQIAGKPFCVVTDYDLPERFGKRKVRVDVLVRRFEIEQPDIGLLSKDLFAFSVVSDSIHKLNGAFSRKYMLEIIEHMLNSYPNYTYFAETSGAPYQREVAGALVEYCGDRPA